jgi:hypothetical protein
MQRCKKACGNTVYSGTDHFPIFLHRDKCMTSFRLKHTTITDTAKPSTAVLSDPKTDVPINTTIWNTLATSQLCDRQFVLQRH